jgi:hypothetical protein
VTADPLASGPVLQRIPTPDAELAYLARLALAEPGEQILKQLIAEIFSTTTVTIKTASASTATPNPSSARGRS